MRVLFTVVAALWVFAAFADAQDSDEFTVKAMPPSVVKTVPQAGQTDVDPLLDQISVTFSKDMLTERMWAVVQVSKEHFPKIRETAKGTHYLGERSVPIVFLPLTPI